MKETVIRLSSFWQLSGKKLLTVHGAVHHASRGVFPDSCQRFWWHGVNSFLFAVIGLFQRFCSIYFDFFLGQKDARCGHGKSVGALCILGLLLIAVRLTGFACFCCANHWWEGMLTLFSVNESM